MQGSNFEKKEEQGKWSLTAEEEARSWRTILQRFQAALIKKLSVPVPLKIDSLLEVFQCHSSYGTCVIVNPMKLLRLF